jgi:hypothetical protein
MDTVSGAELNKSTMSGYYVRTGLIKLTSADLPVVADTSIIWNPFALSGCPQEGQPINSSYPDWICLSRSVKPVNTLTWRLFTVYRWMGAIGIRDHTTLQQIDSFLNPSTMQPVYNIWKNPNAAEGTPPTIPKLCHFRDFLPVRSLTFTRTVNFEASAAVESAIRSVNQVNWQGLPPGYWLVTDIDGQSQDNGITNTYNVTFSTQTIYDWSSFDYMEDFRGEAVYIDPVKFNTLITNAYTYGTPDTTTCSGVVRLGRFPMVDFYSVFGIADTPYTSAYPTPTTP